MFDIASVLKDVSGPDTGKEQIEYIQLDQIDPDPNNFYSLEGLGDLAANIELIGLQQPLRVRPGSEPGRYIIVSGHRRRAAILMIRDGGSDQFDAGVACIVDRGEASKALQELRLIYANSATRVMTPAELSRQAERVEMLLYTLKEEGMEFPGRMRDHVAEACKVSKTKLARLHAIRNNLNDRWLRKFDSGELSEELAYQLSRLPAEILDEAADRMETGKQKKLPIAVVVEKVNRNLAGYRESFPCRSHAGGPPCHHLDEKILRSLFAPYEWQVCEPGQCCRDCYHAASCSRACEECKDRRKLEKAVEAEKAAERKKNEEAQQQTYRKARQKEAGRVMTLVDNMDLAEDAELPSLANWASWQKGPKVESMRKMAAGDFGDAHFYDSKLLPTSVEGLGWWADFLGCSLDYLAGRTEEPKPQRASGPDTGTRWSTGTPAEPGEYVIVCGAPREKTPGSWIKSIQRWNGDEWADSKGVPLRLTVYEWIRLPEVER